MTDFIEYYDSVLSPEFCQRLIAKFDSSKHKLPGRTGGGVDTNKKVSEDILLNGFPEFEKEFHEVTDACARTITSYVSKYFFSLISGISITLQHPETKKPVMLTADNFEEIGKANAFSLLRYLYRLAPINMQKYQQGKGNYGYWHSEIYPQTGTNDSLHRTLLFIIYLNDVEEGGETDFFYQERSIKPKAGSMIVAPCGFTHTHRGNIPVSNDKYVLTSWVMFNPAEQIYTQP